MNRRVRVALAILIFVLAGALVACGEDPKPKKEIAASDFSDPENGVSFRAPAGAVIGDGRETQVVVLRRGNSTLVVSRFDRAGADLPRTETQLERAARALEGEYRRKGARTARSRPDASATAVMVLTEEGADKGTHVHFYERGNEYVVDCVSPSRDFKRAQSLLCDPVAGTIVFSRPRS